MSSGYANDRLITAIERIISAYQREIITTHELVNGIVDYFAHDSQVSFDRARMAIRLIPDDARELLTQIVEASFQTDFRWDPVRFGPGNTTSDIDEQTSRFQAWARELRQLLTPPGAPRG